MEKGMSDKKGTVRPMPPKGIGHFAVRLRFLIGDQSVRSFERESGVSEGTIRKYLSGERTPTLDRLKMLSDAGDVPAEWLATGRSVIGTNGVMSGPQADPVPELLAAVMVALERALAGAESELDYEQKLKLGRSIHDLVVVFFDRDAEIVTSLNPEDLVGLARLYLRSAGPKG
jgi:transcriptional regulator with XRE-family HTH domain